MKRIDLIAGARSDFMKNVPIIAVLNNAETQGYGISEETTMLIAASPLRTADSLPVPVPTSG